jgi:hypothetical protein
VALGGGAGWSGRRAGAQSRRCGDGGQADLAVIRTVEEPVADAAARSADGRSTASTVA